jgi:hypothetical protein
MLQLTYIYIYINLISLIFIYKKIVSLKLITLGLKIYWAGPRNKTRTMTPIREVGG